MQNDQKRARQIVARGVSAWERDDFESAPETFQGVLVDFPQFADVQNKAAPCLAMLSRPEESLAHFDAALQYNPAYAEAHLNRGIILNDLGRHEEDQLSL
jgi:tetratricopeptide (TPR) repeat protein